MLTEILRRHIKMYETESAELVLGYCGISFEQLTTKTTSTSPKITICLGRL